ncbi:MAG: NAD(P)-dependent oxidoreductase [Dehalococcoidales bacterium]
MVGGYTGRKARIGLTRDFFDENGKFMMPGPGLKLLDDMPNVEYQMFPEFLREVIPEQIEGFDMVVTFRPLWTKQSIAGNNQLLSIHRGGVGYERLDVSALTDSGIMLFITPGAVRRPMAVVYITFVLALSIRLLTKDKLIRERRWAEQYHYQGYGLVGRTLGAIGVGNIGHEMFKLAKPFEMKHIAYDPYITPEAVADIGAQLVDLDTVLTESDFLTIICPLNEETRHLISEKELKKMKRTAFLINAARGPIVDEIALIKALQESWIQGAGLDVFEQEPILPDNPLLKLDNVILSPHALAQTDQTFSTMWHIIVEQLSAITRGEIPETLVNREVLDKPEFQTKLKRFLEAIK